MITSYRTHESWKPPYMKEPDSIEQPATAPPTVMVRSSGTTVGIRPCGSVASTSWSNVTPASATQIRRSGTSSRISVRPVRSTLSSARVASCSLGTWCDTAALRNDTGPPGARERAHLVGDLLQLARVAVGRRARVYPRFAVAHCGS